MLAEHNFFFSTIQNTGPILIISSPQGVFKLEPTIPAFCSYLNKILQQPEGFNTSMTNLNPTSPLHAP